MRAAEARRLRRLLLAADVLVWSRRVLRRELARNRPVRSNSSPRTTALELLDCRASNERLEAPFARLRVASPIEARLPDINTSLERFDQDLVRSAIPTYCTARLAAEHVKVAVAGRGRGLAAERSHVARQGVVRQGNGSFRPAAGGHPRQGRANRLTRLPQEASRGEAALSRGMRVSSDALGALSQPLGRTGQRRTLGIAAAHLRGPMNPKNTVAKPPRGADRHSAQ